MGTVPRRKRGTGLKNVQMMTSVPQEQKDLVFRIAKTAGISASETMELILDEVLAQMQPDGFPAWFVRDELPEELPIRRAG